MAAMNRLTFRATMAQVSVPATSANLGPGFDSLALALDIRDRYVAQVLDDQVIDVDVTGEGADEVRKDAKNLVVQAMMKGFDFMGGKPRGIALRALNVIPHGRGLGSSASAIVGGLHLARSLVLSGEEYMSDEDLVALAAQMEGHPDNVAAAFLGGATIAWTEDIHGEKYGRAVGITVDPRIRAIIFVPEAHLATSKARKLLPENIPHRDAVANSTNTALLVHALSKRPDLLFAATEDYLHQSYRAEAMPKSVALVKKLRAAGVAATISGAGPSVLVLHTGDDAEASDIFKVAPSTFTPRIVSVTALGASAQ